MLRLHVNLISTLVVVNFKVNMQVFGDFRSELGGSVELATADFAEYLSIICQQGVDRGICL